MTHDRRVIMYRSFAECFNAFIDADGDQSAIKDGMWSWTDEFGNQHSIKVESAKRKIRKRGAWGWTQSGVTIHLWVKNSQISMGTVLEVIAHEMGHTMDPKYLDYHKEELKASRYQHVTRNTFSLASIILEKMENDGR